MDNRAFQEVVHKVPTLTSEGLAHHDDPISLEKRREFLSNPLFLEEARAAALYLERFEKSERFSDWQRQNVTPQNLIKLIARQVGRPISIGSVIAAALYLGFTMGVRDGFKVYFNCYAPQLETEFARLRTQMQIEQVMNSASPY